MLLIGGKGTRLRPLTFDMPKAMIEVDGKPFLEYQLAILKKWGFKEFIFLTGYKAELIHEYFGNGSKWNVKIEYAFEKELLGTAGAIKNAEGLVKGTGAFLVLNGDSIHSLDFRKFVEYHKKKHSMATMAICKLPDPSRSGLVQTDKQGNITSFIEKGKGPPGLSTINAGIYVFEQEFLKLIPLGRPVSLENEIFPQIIGKGFKGYEYDGYFIDVGTQESYAQFREDAKAKIKKLLK
jgi:mannose-1-phosphate guanylyltransferase